NFYARTLGWPVVERWPDRDVVWVMAGDRTRIGLWRPQVGLAGSRGGVHVHFALAIAEADYDAAALALRDRGLDVHEERFGDGRRRRPAVSRRDGDPRILRRPAQPLGGAPDRRRRLPRARRHRGVLGARPRAGARQRHRARLAIRLRHGYG